MHSKVDLSRKKIFNPLECSQRLASEYLFGIFKSSLETFFHFVRDLFYIQEIRGRVLTLGSISV
jgi:hypothetical protein